ncbi:hypothetical protein C8J57DRAFT_1721316 [Mycena rebaudengoi]|nr:hypothetical protein C8J57DRAFT_1721316 [Mycena rebaudengoi]
MSPSSVESLPADICTPPSQTWIHKDWYTDPTLPIDKGWSTDWEDFESLFLWTHTIRGTLKIDKLKEVFGLTGTLEPLAYMLYSGGLFFLFTMGGRYYYFSDGYLLVHIVEFASPREFLWHALQKGGDHMPEVDIPRRPGMDLSWWHKQEP